jgi:hypothetical protein
LLIDRSMIPIINNYHSFPPSVNCSVINHDNCINCTNSFNTPNIYYFVDYVKKQLIQLLIHIYLNQ